MSLLIAVKSCQRDREQGFHEAIRNTWGNILPEDVALRFFMGGIHELSNTIRDDEVYLNCLDDYMSLPKKTWAILNWFLGTGYDHIFLCDNDTYVNVPELMKLPFQKYDYSGKSSHWPPNAQIGVTFSYNDGKGNLIQNCHPWASGGYGYFLSRHAARIVVLADPSSWAEDLSVGQVLGPRTDVTKFDYPIYRNRVTWHWWKPIGGEITPEHIRQAYQNGAPSGRIWGAP